MKKVSLRNTMVSMTKVIIAMVIAIALSVGATYGIMAIKDYQEDKSCYEVMYTVVAENDEQYILQDDNDTNHYETIDKSEMFGVGETVTCVYVDGQITSVWLYVDC